MESKLSNILLETRPNSDKILVRLTANKNFPFDSPKKFRILRGQPSRSMFVDRQIVCASDDCETGFSVNGTKQECATCENKSSGACSYKCLIYMEHPEHGKEYVLGIPYAAQYALSEYVKSLLVEDLDAPDVYTIITRIQTPDNKSTYIFELADDFEVEEETAVELTSSESDAIKELLSQIRERSIQMDIEEFAETLKYMEEFIGIEDDRAKRIAKSIASKDGLIK
ncbi:hypothetical protein [Bacteroides sp.]|uniref:hypothetical protein n=1 Tax=Bacteroides sp. TaxID=29523 RepID=UPI002609567E|nr:hypothetical protein [Bacteroides sp.]MDD3040569.1 hypothetical protein [Bacteroides sp.]